jgi:hypothetical protein
MYIYNSFMYVCIFSNEQTNKQTKQTEAHREEFFRDDPRDGNLVHALIRRGHTKSLLQIILPNHPDVRALCRLLCVCVCGVVAIIQPPR